MITTKAIRRTKKERLEDNKDFYQTNYLMVKALKDFLVKLEIPEKASILDPCCGDGVIYKGLIDTFYNINYFDKYKKRVYGNFFNHDKNYDIIVMNPPYSKLKYKFLKKAFNQATMVICLLPLNISNYNDFSCNYEDIPNFVGKIQMSPKTFLHEGTEFKSGGTSQYCWYIWRKDYSEDFSKTWYINLRELKK